MNKIIITGSNGFIGKHLSKYLKKKKYKVIELTSSNKNKKSLKWSLGNKFPIKNLNNTFLLHFAFDIKSLKKNENIKKNKNYISSIMLAKNIEKSKNSKFFYISSQTASNNALSLYGKIKYLIEKKVQKNKKTRIIVPGFVYHKQDSKVVSAIKKILKFQIFPIFISKKNIYPIHINDFCIIMEKILADNNFKKYNVGTKKALNLEDFISFICKDNKIPKPIFIYLPFFIVTFFAILGDKLKILNLSIFERINSLIQLKNIDTSETINNLKLNIKFNFKIN